MDLEYYNNIPAFVLFAVADVHYDGRASSILERGNYLIIKKEDGSFMVHGACHVPALNYMSSGSIIHIKGNIITVTRRSETIRTKIYNCYEGIPILGWSDHKIKIRKTEAELTARIIDDPETYLGPGIYTAHREYPTLAGPVDLVLTSTVIYTIEVKRKRISLKDSYQLQRYLDAFAKVALVEKKHLNMPPGCEIVGCLAGPDISINALNHCRENGIRYLPVQFEEEVL